MSWETTELRYLGVVCQHCTEPIAVPERFMNRQIVVSEDESDSASRYISTLLNLRCKACRREYFYDVSEISEFEGTPLPSGRLSHRAHSAPSHKHRLRSAHA